LKRVAVGTGPQGREAKARKRNEKPEQAGSQAGKSKQVVDSGRTGKRTVNIRLAGKDYGLRSDADEDSLQQVAAYVDRSMQVIRDRTDTVDSLDVALLAALQLAREVLQLRKASEGSAGQGVDSDRLQALIEVVEHEVSESDSHAIR